MIGAILLLPVLALGQLVVWTGKDSLSVEDFSRQYGTWLRQRVVPDSPEIRLQFINEQIEESVITLYGREMGLFQDTQVQETGQQARRELLLNSVARNQQVEEIPVAPEDVEAEYRYQNTVLLARYLTLPDLYSAREYRARWQAGEPFESLALQAAETPGFMDQPGEPGWRFYHQLDSLFARRAYALSVGEISPPMKTGQEYQVIQLLGKEFRPNHGHFERVRHYHRIAADLRPFMITTTARQTLEDWASSLPFEWNRRSIRRILRANLLNNGLDGITDDPKTAKLFGETVFTIDARSYSLDWLRSNAEVLLPSERIPVTAEEDLYSLCQQLMMWMQLEELVAIMPAGKSLLSEADSIRALIIQETVRDSIHARVLRQTVPSEDSLRSFLAAHEDQYRTPALINLSEIVVQNAALGDALLDSIVNLGVDFGVLARRHTSREWARKLNGDLGWVPLELYGFLAPSLAAATGSNPDNVIGPERVNGYIVLALPNDYREEGLPAFETLRPRLREAWVQIHREDVISEWIQRMQRDNYGVRVDTGLVMRFEVDESGGVMLPFIPDSSQFVPSVPDSIMLPESAGSLTLPDSSRPSLELIIPDTTQYVSSPPDSVYEAAPADSLVLPDSAPPPPDQIIPD